MVAAIRPFKLASAAVMILTAGTASNALAGDYYSFGVSLGYSSVPSYSYYSTPVVVSQPVYAVTAVRVVRHGEYYDAPSYYYTQPAVVVTEPVVVERSTTYAVPSRSYYAGSGYYARSSPVYHRSRRVHARSRTVHQTRQYRTRSYAHTRYTPRREGVHFGFSFGGRDHGHRDRYVSNRSHQRSRSQGNGSRPRAGHGNRRHRR